MLGILVTSSYINDDDYDDGDDFDDEDQHYDSWP